MQIASDLRRIPNARLTAAYAHGKGIPKTRIHERNVCDQRQGAPLGTWALPHSTVFARAFAIDYSKFAVNSLQLVVNPLKMAQFFESSSINTIPGHDIDCKTPNSSCQSSPRSVPTPPRSASWRLAETPRTPYWLLPYSLSYPHPLFASAAIPPPPLPLV